MASTVRSVFTKPMGLNLFTRLRSVPGLANILRWASRTLLRLHPRQGYLRREFNRWATKGLGESMESDHMWLAERTIPRMKLSSNDRVLDLGCGDGWACRFMSKHLNGGGRIVGLDISDEMVRQARAKSSKAGNLVFMCGSAEHIPCPDQSFSKVLSISAFYYFERQERVLKELLRVVAPEGQLLFLTCVYKEHPDWRSTRRSLRVPVRVHTAQEYESMLRAAGWTDVYIEELFRHSDASGSTPGHDRALLVSARRPLLEKDLGLQIARGQSSETCAGELESLSS